MTHEELMRKAREAESAEELLKIAEENQLEMTQESAQAFFNELHSAEGKLSDEQLENVSGGGLHSKDGRLVVTAFYDCDHFKCEKCGSEIKWGNLCSRCNTVIKCKNCSFCTYEKCLLLCNHPANRN